MANRKGNVNPRDSPMFTPFASPSPSTLNLPSRVENSRYSHQWEFPGSGSSHFREDLCVPRTDNDGPTEESSLLNANGQTHKKGHMLGELAATSICGNDISSSCLYVAGICAFYSGKWAPISLILVAVTLYLFRKIYEEAIGAIPLNGATYTVLLNTSTKTMASFAACLTLLSYVSTAVVSASEAVHYAKNIFPEMPIDAATIGLLGFFAFLSFVGMKESSPVAVTIFLIHLGTLCILIVDCFITAFKDDWQTLVVNWQTKEWPHVPHRSVAESIFYGFGAAMLGISGFESSANFVEEQKKGVFKKTLRNMWVCVSILNPLISFLAMSVLPLPNVMGLVPYPHDGRPNNKDLLKMMASTDWLKWLVSFDAALVLSGAVLTSYVGVIGLCRRMALDRCLPGVLLNVNSWTQTNHYIILAFFCVASSLYLIVEGNVLILSGIYTISFLSVMGLFAFGTMLVKYKRSKIQREVKASVMSIIVAFIGVTTGLVANVIVNQEVVKYFFVYYSVAMSIVLIMFWRIQILKIMVTVLMPFKNREVSLALCGKGSRKPFKWLVKRLINYYREIKSQKVVFFVKVNDIAEMNKAASYVRDNEQTNWLVFVHVYDSSRSEGEEIQKSVNVLDNIYPKMKFDFVGIRGEFCPEMVNVISKELNCPNHFMFISCPGYNFKHNISSYGGLRTITH
eukprot:Nk52_evm28s295 gene=Nk52_evmTU28s295